MLLRPNFVYNRCQKKIWPPSFGAPRPIISNIYDSNHLGINITKNKISKVLLARNVQRDSVLCKYIILLKYVNCSCILCRFRHVTNARDTIIN